MCSYKQSYLRLGILINHPMIYLPNSRSPPIRCCLESTSVLFASRKSTEGRIASDSSLELLSNRLRNDMETFWRCLERSMICRSHLYSKIQAKEHSKVAYQKKKNTLRCFYASNKNKTTALICLNPVNDLADAYIYCCCSRRSCSNTFKVARALFIQ